MCGRFGLFAELDALAEQFNFDPSIIQDIYQPRWNIPPTTPILSVRRNSQEKYGKNEVRLLRWGMAGARSPRSKGSGRPLFNARAEDCSQAAVIQAPVQGAPLPGSRQRLLRVEKG